MYEPLLTRTHHLAHAFLKNIDDRPVRPAASFADLTATLGGPLPDEGQDATAVIDALAAAAEAGLMPSAGPRYFGFVTGGSLPATVAADWLVSAWDQNTALHVMSPAVAAVEEVTAAWLLDLLMLPATSSVGFVTGATMANVTALAAARHEVLRRVGWDVEAHGLQGAPRISLLAGAESHPSTGPGGRGVLGGGHRVAGRAGHADIGVQLAHSRGRYRLLGHRHHSRFSRVLLGRVLDLLQIQNTNRRKEEGGAFPPASSASDGAGKAPPSSPPPFDGFRDSGTKRLDRHPRQRAHDAPESMTLASLRRRGWSSLRAASGAIFDRAFGSGGAAPA